MKKVIISILAFGLFVLYVVLKTKEIYAAMPQDCIIFDIFEDKAYFYSANKELEIEEDTEFMFSSEFDGDIIHELVEIFGTNYQYIEWDKIFKFELTEDTNIEYMLENIRDEAAE